MSERFRTAPSWRDLARSVAEELGDVAVVTQAEPAEQQLAVVAAAHKSPEREDLAQALVGERYRRGWGLPGRVWETERGILLEQADNLALIALSQPASKRYLQEVGIRSLMWVPLRVDGQVVGTLGVARDRASAPFTEADFARVQGLAAWGDLSAVPVAVPSVTPRHASARAR